MARKEHEKKYKKIVDNPMLYLEERQHQILPKEHQPEIHSLPFFGSGVEGAAIEVLALIDWAAKYVKISCSPVPEILGFLRRPFIKGKLVKHPIPDDPPNPSTRSASGLRRRRRGPTCVPYYSSGQMRLQPNLER